MFINKYVYVCLYSRLHAFMHTLTHIDTHIVQRQPDAHAYGAHLRSHYPRNEKEAISIDTNVLYFQAPLLPYNC